MDNTYYGGDDDDDGTVSVFRPSLVGEIRQEIPLAGTGHVLLPC